MTQVQLREGEEFPKLPKESADLIVSCMHMHWVCAYYYGIHMHMHYMHRVCTSITSLTS